VAVVQALLDYAALADMVIAFSVFTHLHHEETYAYLQDSWRALKPGGKMAFSILEFSVSENWSVLEHTVAGRQSRTLEHMNTFIERSVIKIWSAHLGFSVDRFIDGGQTFCVLRKPIAPNLKVGPLGPETG